MGRGGMGSGAVCLIFRFVPVLSRYFLVDKLVTDRTI